MNTIVNESAYRNETKENRISYYGKLVLGGLIFMLSAGLAALFIQEFFKRLLCFNGGAACPNFFPVMLVPIILSLPFGMKSSSIIFKNGSFSTLFWAGVCVPALSSLSFGLILAIGLLAHGAIVASSLAFICETVYLFVIPLAFTFWITFPFGWLAALVIKLLLVPLEHSTPILKIHGEV